MPRIYKTEHSSGYTILLVDDSPEYLHATRRLLEREGHQVLTAENGPAALALVREKPVDLVLLDYFMPGMTGEEVVTQLRQFNSFVQVILQTGYSSERPPREMLRRLDIQGYYDKSDGPDNLLLWTDAGLKAAYSMQLLYKSRQGLRYILEITPDLHKVQPLADLLQGILWQVAGLLGAVNSFLAVIPQGGIAHPRPPDSEGFLAMLEDNADLVIRAGTGRFVREDKIDASLGPEKTQLVINALQISRISIVENSTVVPLRVGELTVGVIYLDRPAIQEQDKELLNIFANQAAVAVQNMQLYEMATLDPLTGVYVRRFFDQCMQRELRSAFRLQQPLTLLLADIDQMKQINDSNGHLVGDQALSILGRVLREATRSSDIVGRYGGEEFAIVLPLTRVDGALRVARRIQELLDTRPVDGLAGPIKIQVSLGLSILEPHAFAAAEIPHPLASTYFQTASETLIRNADDALYASKRSGNSNRSTGTATGWQKP